MRTTRRASGTRVPASAAAAGPTKRRPTLFDLDSSKLEAYRDLYLWPIEIKDENMRADCQLNLIGERRAWPGLRFSRQPGWTETDSHRALPRRGEDSDPPGPSRLTINALRRFASFTLCDGPEIKKTPTRAGTRAVASLLFSTAVDRRGSHRRTVPDIVGRRGRFYQQRSSYVSWPVASNCPRYRRTYRRYR